MTDILLLLLREEQLNRDQIISYIREHPDFVRTTSNSSEFVASPKERVSFDRTFKRLRELGFLEGSPRAPYTGHYIGTFWHGYEYRLTKKGELQARRIKKKVKRFIEEYWSLVKGNRESRPMNRRFGFCTRCGVWHRMPSGTRAH
jgi:hypothetical protein